MLRMGNVCGSQGGLEELTNDIKVDSGARETAAHYSSWLRLVDLTIYKVCYIPPLSLMI